MAHCKKNGIETARGNCGKCWVAVLLCHLESTTRRTDRLRKRSRPGDHDCKDETGPSTIVIPSGTLEQIASHLGKSIRSIVLAETGAGDHTHSRVVVRCGVAIASLQAEIVGPEDAQRVQIPVGVQGW